MRAGRRDALRLAAALLAAPRPAGAADAVALVVGRGDVDAPLPEAAEQVLRLACARVGIAPEVRRYPLLRSLEMANAGEIDADLMRIAEVATRYPNLVAVPAPIGTVDLAIYATSPRIAQMSRAQIAALRVGIARGVFVLEKASRGMDVTVATSTAAAFEMLLNGRYDVALLDYLDSEAHILEQRLQGIVRWPAYWASEPLYLLLNRRREALVPRLSDALEALRRAGTIARIEREAMARRGIAALPR